MACASHHWPIQAISWQVTVTQAHGYRHVIVAQFVGIRPLLVSTDLLHISNAIFALRNTTPSLTPIRIHNDEIRLSIAPKFH
jgi:hypothetical protein